MKNLLDKTVDQLGDGETVRLPTGDWLFKLASYERNPIIKPEDIGLTWDEEGKQLSGAVFNPGAELFGDMVVLMPRCHKNYKRAKFFDSKLGKERICLENYISEIGVFVSEDGVSFRRFNEKVIRGDGTDHKDFLYGIEDLRIIKHSHKYLLVGCGKIKPPFKGENADRVAIYSTTDFIEITYHGIIESFDSRNGVPFPDYVDGKLYMLLRFHPNTHLDWLEKGIDQLLHPKRFQEEWRRIYERRSKTLLLESGKYPHEKEKTGPGPPIIPTDVGWLLLYHGVGEISPHISRVYGLQDGIDRAYSICAAILDLKNPNCVIRRARMPIYIPSAPYELYGNEEYSVDVPAVVFPVGAITIQGKLLLYCGAGDKYTILLSCRLENLLNYLLDFG